MSLKFVSDSHTKYGPFTHSDCIKSKLYLRNITEEEKVEWEGKLRNRKFGTTGHKRLDDVCDHIFQRGDGVWVKTTEGNWLQGRIIHNKSPCGYHAFGAPGLLLRSAVRQQDEPKEVVRPKER